MLGDVGQFSSLNPITFYLILVNGVICTLTVIHRSWIIFYNRSNYDKEADGRAVTKKPEDARKRRLRITNAALANLITVGILLFVLGRGVNYHHEIMYIAHDKPIIINDSTRIDAPHFKELTFEKYTRDFLKKMDRSPDSTIYFIAAEGGGLRAAYWTMLVLENLGDTIFNNTFFMSGASGGAIGQGIYTFMKAKKDPPKFKEKIDVIGQHNFLTTDAVGMFTRGILGMFVPHPKMIDYPDRHQHMAKCYFRLIGDDSWERASQLPYYYLWEDSKDHIPLMAINTTRTRDGSRAIVHPLVVNGSPFEHHFEDLSTNYSGNYISFADALFLTNRFPIISPSARIESKGYFVDGGYYENSGLQTILLVLEYMNGRASLGDTIYESIYGPGY